VKKVVPTTPKRCKRVIGRRPVLNSRQDPAQEAAPLLTPGTSRTMGF